MPSLHNLDPNTPLMSANVKVFAEQIEKRGKPLEIPDNIPKKLLTAFWTQIIYNIEMKNHGKIVDMIIEALVYADECGIWNENSSLYYKECVDWVYNRLKETKPPMCPKCTYTVQGNNRYSIWEYCDECFEEKDK